MFTSTGELVESQRVDNIKSCPPVTWRVNGRVRTGILPSASVVQGFFAGTLPLPCSIMSSLASLAICSGYFLYTYGFLSRIVIRRPEHQPRTYWVPGLFWKLMPRRTRGFSCRAGTARSPEGIIVLAVIPLHFLVINSIRLWLFLHAVTPPRHFHAKVVLYSFVLVEILLCNCF